MALALSISELVVIYAIPVALLAALWLAISILVWVLVRSPLDFAFKHDLLAKFKGKRGLPSGPDRFSIWYVASLLGGDSCIQATLLYRVSRFLARHHLRPLARAVHTFSRLVTHTDLAPGASIGPGLLLYHGLGTVIGKGSTIGERALICHGVTIGGGAKLGDDVKVWPHAQVLARVTIGDRTEVSANSVVMQDFPPDSILFGMPARLAGKTSTAPPEPKAEAAVSAG